MSDNTLFWTLIGSVSVFSNRVAEAVKGGLQARFPDIPGDTISFVALVASLIAGVVGALILNLNVLAILPVNPYTGQIPALAGVLLTGCFASLGSEVIHWLLDLAQAGRDHLEATPAPGTTTSTISVAAETTSTPAPTAPVNDAARSGQG